MELAFARKDLLVKYVIFVLLDIMEVIVINVRMDFTWQMKFVKVSNQFWIFPYRSQLKYIKNI